ncbi:restriction endonuclease Mrr [Clostridium tetanomorphum]|uniref:Uncharacterized protein n=1 Tax=Clostridium tetanomorphum TaxID=1553 RepID=A0A923EEV1_CLOTT|nr:hypothetical protein [Clostridium tetanomorphum]KAJ52884.1 hypothetical protein CTM_05297 [Clostridium tetanomorphum DSM 665]MBC2399905.1 hypothetical protein [Clostridium tetanomorphum]MBP1865978.1 restriction endonuclease Mrr [Clostridium tetanomorphum]NRS85968.1 restriction endonuclease Mrr [Clostridium tetanomorphum]NRZ96022.1 restriction endonuclease Mrr [Clostridium tetanomorphum]
MKGIYNKIYFKLRKKEVERGKIILKRIDLEDVNKRISKICWNNGIEYSIILKKSDILLLSLKGSKELVVLKFTKKDMTFAEEFDSFLDFFYKYDANRGIYITTGVFEEKIRYKCNYIPMYKKIRLVDKYSFIKEQLGIGGKALEELKENKLKLYRYLPD